MTFSRKRSPWLVSCVEQLETRALLAAFSSMPDVPTQVSLAESMRTEIRKSPPALFASETEVRALTQVREVTSASPLAEITIVPITTPVADPISATVGLNLLVVPTDNFVSRGVPQQYNGAGLLSYHAQTIGFSMSSADTGGQLFDAQMLAPPTSEPSGGNLLTGSEPVVSLQDPDGPTTTTAPPLTIEPVPDSPAVAPSQMLIGLTMRSWIGVAPAVVTSKPNAQWISYTDAVDTALSGVDIAQFVIADGESDSDFGRLNNPTAALANGDAMVRPPVSPFIETGRVPLERFRSTVELEETVSRALQDASRDEHRRRLAHTDVVLAGMAHDIPIHSHARAPVETGQVSSTGAVADWERSLELTVLPPVALRWWNRIVCSLSDGTTILDGALSGCAIIVPAILTSGLVVRLLNSSCVTVRGGFGETFGQALGWVGRPAPNPRLPSRNATAGTSLGRKSQVNG